MWLAMNHDIEEEGTPPQRGIHLRDCGGDGIEIVAWEERRDSTEGRVDTILSFGDDETLGLLAMALREIVSFRLTRAMYSEDRYRGLPIKKEASEIRRSRISVCLEICEDYARSDYGFRIRDLAEKGVSITYWEKPPGNDHKNEECTTITLWDDLTICLVEESLRSLRQFRATRVANGGEG